MKVFLFSLMTIAAVLAGSNAHAFPTAPEQVRPYELMKCNSQKFGTIWASFGHIIRSGEDELAYFPTEIVLLAPDHTERLLFPNLNDAFKFDLKVGSGKLHMTFISHVGTVEQKNAIQIGVVDPRDQHAFAGNWKATRDGVETDDAIYCSLD